MRTSTVDRNVINWLAWPDSRTSMRYRDDPRRPSRSATATSGRPSALKSATAFDQPKGVAELVRENRGAETVVPESANAGCGIAQHAIKNATPRANRHAPRAIAACAGPLTLENNFTPVNALRSHPPQ